MYQSVWFVAETEKKINVSWVETAKLKKVRNEALLGNPLAVKGFSDVKPWLWYPIAIFSQQPMCENRAVFGKKRLFTRKTESKETTKGWNPLWLPLNVWKFSLVPVQRRPFYKKIIKFTHFTFEKHKKLHANYMKIILCLSLVALILRLFFQKLFPERHFRMRKKILWPEHEIPKSGKKHSKLDGRMMGTLELFCLKNNPGRRTGGFKVSKMNLN